MFQLIILKNLSLRLNLFLKKKNLQGRRSHDLGSPRLYLIHRRRTVVLHPLFQPCFSSLCSLLSPSHSPTQFPALLFFPTVRLFFDHLKQCLVRIPYCSVIIALGFLVSFFICSVFTLSTALSLLDLGSYLLQPQLQFKTMLHHVVSLPI